MNKIMLQPSEWIIMERLWETNPKTLMQLYHELKLEPGWSKSTVTTLLGRMVDKGILYYELLLENHAIISQQVLLQVRQNKNST